jgi:segregation and condensation protein A
MAYRVRLRQFDGPFDLLVYLIENSRMNIYDIKISEITRQYIDFLSDMQEMNVEVSSDFLVLAAELIEIKSKMLLPSYDGDEEKEKDEEDPRKGLVSQILEYKRCKAAGEMLAERFEYTSMMYEKPCDDISEYADNPEVYINLDIKDFSRAFMNFLSRKQRIEAAKKRYTRLERDRETMQSRMLMIRNVFQGSGNGGTPVDEVDFRALVPRGDGRSETVVSFTSLLEMMRERYLDADQRCNYGDITVKKGERPWESGEVPGKADEADEYYDDDDGGGEHGEAEAEPAETAGQTETE